MADILSKLSGGVGGLFKQEGQSVLGVDVSSSTIKVVQLKREGGKAILETYGELSLGPYAGVDVGKATRLSSEKVADALKDLMKEAKVSTNNAGVAIPLSSSLINVIEMPDVGEKRLKEMIPIEMRKYIPVNISEVLLDWRVIPRNEDYEEEETEESKTKKAKKFDKVDVLVVAIHKETITKYQEITSLAGLESSFFEIEVFSTIRSVIDGSNSSVMVMDMGAGTTKLYVTDHRVLRQSHIVNRGSQDITIALSKSMGITNERALELKHTHGMDPNAPDKSVKEVVSLVLDSILSEAHRVLFSYQKRYQENVGQVIITGGGAALKGLQEATAKTLQTEVVVADPFAKVVAPAFLEDILKSVGPEFAVAVGVALRKLNESG